MVWPGLVRSGWAGRAGARSGKARHGEGRLERSGRLLF